MPTSTVAVAAVALPAPKSPATAWADDSGDCGDGVTSIGDWAFQGCTSLLSIEIPASVTGIGNYAFALSAATSVRCCKHQILRVEP